MTKQNHKIKVFEGFAGYGGASFGLRKANIPFEVIGFSEIDDDAINMYSYNFPKIKNFGDITSLDASKIPDFDLFTGGFPCQPFSTIGKRMGELDTRGTLFADIIRICEEKKPKYILLENVRGLTVGKQKATFLKILSELERIGYPNPQWALLNSKDYGIPQNRERLWIFAAYGGLPANFNIVPPKVESNLRLKDFLDKSPDPSLYRSKAQIERIHEIRYPEPFNVTEPLCFDYYNNKIRYDGICMAVTPPEHNIMRIIEPNVNGEERFRKFSIDELFRLMGFVINDKTREIAYPPDMSYAKLGKRAGNGWDVNLVGILLKHIFSQLS